jgi:hypothetical protein
MVEMGDAPTGRLIGPVTLVDCVREHASQWADPENAWKLVLRDPVPLRRPVPYRGQLNLFKVPLHLVAELLPPGSLGV